MIGDFMTKPLQGKLFEKIGNQLWDISKSSVPISVTAGVCWKYQRRDPWLKGSSVNREFDCWQACRWLGYLGAVSLNLMIDKRCISPPCPLSSVNCLETTLLVKLAIDSLVLVQQEENNPICRFCNTLMGIYSLHFITRCDDICNFEVNDPKGNMHYDFALSQQVTRKLIMGHK